MSHKLSGATYDDWPLKLMTPEDLLQHGKDGGIVNYVWPYEGRVTSEGAWKFHGGKIMDGTTEINGPAKPLLVDAASARAFMLVWELISEPNRNKTRKLMQSRGLFIGIVMEKLVWPHVGFGGSQ